MTSILKAGGYAAGALACAYLILESLWTGSSTSLGYASRVMGERHSATAEPSQFWFMQALFLAGVVYFGYKAWREYRG